MRLTARETVPVAALTAVGAALRIVAAHQSLFADEFSTYWISATHSLGGVVSLMYGTGPIKHAEITPPLYFLAAWLTAQISHSPEFLRLPSLIAGTLTIPAVYLLGRRLLGTPQALVAAALTTLSPFMIYYSAEARAYALMMLLVTLSTLSMLLALDTRRHRWWLIYALCSCAAVYAHYTCIFVLAAQFAWLLWTQPQARRAAIIANVAAAFAVAPWIPGVINNLNSPTVNILSSVSPFTFGAIRGDLLHWAIGYPYGFVPIGFLPGRSAVLLASVGLAVAIVQVARRQPAGTGARELPGDQVRLQDAVLLLMLLVFLPVAELLISALGNRIFGVRELAASWPALALCLALLVTSGRRLRFVAAGLVTASFAIGAVKEVSSKVQRPDYRSALKFVSANARPGDVVIDGTGVVDPGPLTPVDISLHTRAVIARALAPAESGHPFGIADHVVSLPEATRRAVTLIKPGGSIFGVSVYLQPADDWSLKLPRQYKVVATRRYPGIVNVAVRVYRQVAVGPR